MKLAPSGTDNDLAHDLRNERPLDAARERVADLAEKAAAWAAADLSDAEIGRRAADYFNQLRGGLKRIEDERKVGKAPSLAAGRAIDKAAAELSEPLEEPFEMMSRRITEHLKERRAAGEENPRLQGNYSQRAIALKSIWRAEIIDQLQAYLWFADHPDVAGVLAKLANAEAPAAHREAREIPGARLIEKEIAA